MLSRPIASTSRCSCAALGQLLHRPNASTARSSALGGLLLEQRRTATKRAAKHTDNKKDSPGRALGVKRQQGHMVQAGEVLVRQVGSNIWPGQHCGMGRDFTIFAKQPGYVRFYSDKKYPGQTSMRRINLRKYCGIVFHPDERLPRDEAARGRERRLGLVEINGLRRYLTSPDPRAPRVAPPASSPATASELAEFQAATDSVLTGVSKSPASSAADPFVKPTSWRQRFGFMQPRARRELRDPTSFA